MASFDVHDRNSWYFGSMTRQEATDLLMNEREIGVFLVRASNTSLGDYVLCVREDTKVSNYIINKIQHPDQMYVYRIGDQSFADLPDLLTFYKSHYLDTAPLRRPATRPCELVIGKFDFDGSGDQDDLPFRRGEILTVISKDEEQWWTARNYSGKVGQIPVPYVQKYEKTENSTSTLERNSADNLIGIRHNSGGGNAGNPLASPHQLGSVLKKSDLNRKLPALARVKQARVPNAYDKTALKLEVGDIITVTKTNINGQWEGELNGKKGHFPFTHVEFIESNEHDCDTTTTAATTTTNSTTATGQSMHHNLHNSSLSSSTNLVGANMLSSNSATMGCSVGGAGGGGGGGGGNSNLILGNNEWCE